MTAAPAITCPRCGKTSHHPLDVANGYCGYCHDWTAPACNASQPPDFIECNRPATILGLYVCRHGHAVIAHACAEHDPAKLPEGWAVGCRACKQADGHECPMAWAVTR